MNKKEAVAYAQITLDYMQNSKYSGEINPKTFGIEMKNCFRLYSRDVALHIANIQAENNKI
ncbi:MAG: hypothetical protein HFJ52_08745 [Clostridia bacterium]|nr:hypothetical protein [Clostridia bacterium]